MFIKARNHWISNQWDYASKIKGSVYQKEQTLFYTASNIYQASNKLNKKSWWLLMKGITFQLKKNQSQVYRFYKKIVNRKDELLQKAFISLRKVISTRFEWLWLYFTIWNQLCLHCSVLDVKLFHNASAFTGKS